MEILKQGDALPPKKPEKAEKSIKEEMEDFLNRREQREVAALALSIDKAKLEKTISETDDERGKELLELFARLPEKLDFKPGKTLIVGENASGKSTLAKALFLAGKVKKTAESFKETAAITRDEKEFVGADESAEKAVFEPSGGYDEEFNRSSGLAPVLGRALKVQDFFSASATVEYADFQEIIGRIRKGYDGLTIGSEVSDSLALGNVTGADYRATYGTEVEQATREHMEKVSKRSKEMGSARQTVEKAAGQLIHGDEKKPGPGTYFLDEPESGISPMRHRKIEKNIDNMIGADHEGSIAIIPTNSIVLFESDLPRIDLRYPERGIFRPSQYSDYFED